MHGFLRFAKLAAFNYPELSNTRAGLQSYGTEMLNIPLNLNGGEYRNRTGVHGFAILETRLFLLSYFVK